MDIKYGMLAQAFQAFGGVFLPASHLKGERRRNNGDRHRACSRAISAATGMDPVPVRTHTALEKPYRPAALCQLAPTLVSASRRALVATATKPA